MALREPTPEAASALGETLFARSYREVNLEHLHRIYPQPHGYLAPLLPDLLGEAMTLRLIERNNERPQDYIARVFADASIANAQCGFEV